jgi:hypothetical protein
VRIITATLSIDDRNDPPRAGLTVDVDGHPPVLQSDDIPPADLVATLNALSEAVGVDLKPLVADRITDVVAHLETAVADGEARQAVRVQALLDWQQAAT